MVSQGIQHFSQFLDLYLQQLLRPEWIIKQSRLPSADRHPVVQWRQAAIAASRQVEGEMVRVASGAGRAWFRLAYDLYLIENNAELQNALVRRIRTREDFQGARFEAAVAAMMLPAGYQLEFIPSCGPGKRVELIATHRSTGQRLAVEAKSKSRPGVLGFSGARVLPDRLNIWRLLHNAVEKNPADPLLIFLELNVPQIVRIEEEPSPCFAATEIAWQHEVSKSRPEGFPAIGVVFYNDASPWCLAEDLAEGCTDVACFAKGTDRHRHEVDARALIQPIVLGCYQRLNIPV